MTALVLAPGDISGGKTTVDLLKQSTGIPPIGVVRVAGGLDIQSRYPDELDALAAALMEAASQLRLAAHAQSVVAS